MVDNSGEFHAPPGYPCPVSVIDLPNPGYGVAANVGVRRLLRRHPYAMITTQDFCGEANGAEQLVRMLDASPEVGAAAPLLVDAFTPDSLFSAGGLLSRNGRMTHEGSGQQVGEWRGRPARPAAWADGACLLRIAAVEEVGGFARPSSSSSKMVDFALRMRQHGWGLLVSPLAVGSQSPGRYLLYLKYRSSSSIFFARKHSASLRAWPWWILAVLDVLRSPRGRRASALRWIARGIRDGYGGRMGEPPFGALDSPTSCGQHPAERWVRARLHGDRIHPPRTVDLRTAEEITPVPAPRIRSRH